MFKNFSTAARVHPNVLPHMRPARRTPSYRWVKTIIAISIIGFASKSYFDFARERRTARAIAEDQDRKRRDQMMMDMYGDRSSLEDLERAVAEYSKK